MSVAADTFAVELPCPECGQRTVFGYYFRNQRGEHQHTHYVCTFWPSSRDDEGKVVQTTRCGWHGWSVPPAPPGVADPNSLARVLGSHGIEITDTFLFQYQHDALVHRLVDIVVRLCESQGAST